jgi:lincosamide nucleotidyltransferase A/C/D/E
MMSEKDAVFLLAKAAGNNIELWIDGGWGVDALLGRQTRPHDDIDVFIQRNDNTRFVEMLINDGFGETETAFTTDGHKAFTHADGRAVDLHLFEFIENDRLCFEGESYPSYILRGQGQIGGFAVKCLSAEAQVLYHQGYEHDENDAHDVLLICDAFSISIPDAYAEEETSE